MDQPASDFHKVFCEYYKSSRNRLAGENELLLGILAAIKDGLRRRQQHR